MFLIHSFIYLLLLHFYVNVIVPVIQFVYSVCDTYEGRDCVWEGGARCQYCYVTYVYIVT